MKPEVKKSKTVDEFETEERCYIQETANDSGDEFVSIARARVKPGVTTAWHELRGVTERYIIVGGQGLIEIDDLNPIEVYQGDVARIPADTPQRIKNIGETDLVFYVVCSPRFQVSCYHGLE